MSRFLRIVAGAVAIFIAMSMIEERETFATNWFSAAEKFRAPEADQRAAAEAVHQFRTLAAHWYGTGGDRRFAERLPATPPVIDELRSDIEYVRQNGRIETPRLMRLDVTSVEVRSEAAAEVKTREMWVTEFHWIAGGTSDATRSDVLFVRYRLLRDGARWLVSAWDPTDAPRPEERK